MKTPEELGVTRQQFNNLFKLAHYLLKGKLKAKFDMRDFITTRYDAGGCGTACCAIGHGPYAGIPKPWGKDWRDYSLENFAAVDWLHHGNDDKGRYTFLFHFGWESIDNSSEGAGKRILYYLKYGKLLSIRKASVKKYSCIRLVRKSHSKPK